MIESGQRNPSLEKLVSIASALKVTTDYLLGLAEQASPGSELIRLGTGNGSLSDKTDMVGITQYPGIMAANQGNVALSSITSIAISVNSSEPDSINLGGVEFVVVQGNSMYPTLPDGTVVLIDRGRTGLNHNFMYLISVNTTTYEIRRLRQDNQGKYHWHTDIYLDLEQLPNANMGRLIDSWRGEVWFGEMRRNSLLSRSPASYAPFPHTDGIIVWAGVLGMLHLFDVDGW